MHTFRALPNWRKVECTYCIATSIRDCHAPPSNSRQRLSVDHGAYQGATKMSRDSRCWTSKHTPEARERTDASSRTRGASSIPHGFADAVPELRIPDQYEACHRTNATPKNRRQPHCLENQATNRRGRIIKMMSCEKDVLGHPGEIMPAASSAPPRPCCDMGLCSSDQCTMN